MSLMASTERWNTSNLLTGRKKNAKQKKISTGDLYQNNKRN